MIISRYLRKEVTSTLFAVTLVFLLIFLSNWLVRFLSYAATGKLAANIILQLMGFEIPYLLALLLPAGLFLGIILAYGKLYADSELRVLHACGLSLMRLIKMTSGVAFVVAIVVLVLMLWINPWLANEKGKLIAQSTSRENFLETLIPGRFQVGNDGKSVAYVEKISRNHKRANNLFIAEQHPTPDQDNTEWVVVSANEGSQERDLVTGDRFIVANDGYRYEGIPGQNAYQIIQFRKYSVRMAQSMIHNNHQEEEAIPTATLWKTYDNLQNAAELQWRLSIALSAVLLMFLAVPLSHVRPRYGKYSQLLPAILIYVVYVNLLIVARNWIEIKMIPVSIGMWWVHALVLLLAIILILPQTRWLRRTS